MRQLLSALTFCVLSGAAVSAERPNPVIIEVGLGETLGEGAGHAWRVVGCHPHRHMYVKVSVMKTAVLQPVIQLAPGDMFVPEFGQRSSIRLLPVDDPWRCRFRFEIWR